MIRWNRNESGGGPARAGRVASLARTLGLVLAVASIVLACSPVLQTGVPSATPADATPAESRRASRMPPCTGDEFVIDLLGATHALPAESPEAQREQMRDWIWNVTLGRIAQGSSVDAVFSGVVDEPIVRDDSLAHVLRLPVGPTRAVTTK